MSAVGGPDELIALLRQTPQILSVLLDPRRSSDEATDADSWTVAEIVGHLIDVEQRAIDRIALLQEADQPPLDSFDPSKRVTERGYREEPARALYERFASLRQQRLDALEALDAAAWERAGVLPNGDLVTLRDITIHMCRHDVDHIAQIARLLSSSASVSA